MRIRRAFLNLSKGWELSLIALMYELKNKELRIIKIPNPAIIIKPTKIKT